MPDRFEECRTAVGADVNEVLSVLSFASAAFKTSASVGPILSQVASQKELRKVVDEFRLARVADLNLLYQSLFIQLWSAFEFCIRGLVIAFLDECCKKQSDFEFLRKANLIDRNLYHTGVALQQILENRTHLDFQYFDLAKNIASAIPESTKVILNTSAFTIFLKGPSVQGIEEALKRVGLKNFDWDSLGRSAPIQRALGTRAVRETTKELRALLTEAEKIRNHIVHRGEKIQPVSENDLRRYAAVFQATGQSLADFLEEAVRKL